MINHKTSIVFLGATGAVGSATLDQLCTFNNISRLLLLGRRKVENLTSDFVEQQNIDIFNPETYSSHLKNFDAAICTLGVGEPSKMKKEDFIKIDKIAVLDFAKECKKAGIKHFQLLASVGIDSASSNYYLKAKGELVDELQILDFERLSIFQPSMIITPNNRYGFSQGILLKIWPILSFILIGGLKKYRGINVDLLGKSIANNINNHNSGMERLEWDELMKLI